MALLQIATPGTSPPALMAPALALRFDDWPVDRLRELVGDMLLTLHGHDGVGLAAPQIGVDVQAAVIDTRREPPLVLINPRRQRTSRDRADHHDACLSLPGWTGLVRRPVRAWIQAQDVRGRWFAFCAQGHQGRVVQHELDHRAGVLYPQRLAPGATLERSDPGALADRALATLFDAAPAAPLPSCREP